MCSNLIIISFRVDILYDMLRFNPEHDHINELVTFSTYLLNVFIPIILEELEQAHLDSHQYMAKLACFEGKPHATFVLKKIFVVYYFQKFGKDTL